MGVPVAQNLPDVTTRLSALGSWAFNTPSFTGGGLVVPDNSGNARNLTISNGSTKWFDTGHRSQQGVGVSANTAAPCYFYNQDLAFDLTGAVTIELLLKVEQNPTTSRPIMGYGAGTGGSTKNLRYGVFIQAIVDTNPVTGGFCFAHQSGTNVNQINTSRIGRFRAGTDWMHWTVWRQGNVGGFQQVAYYFNGRLVYNGFAMTACTSGGAAATNNLWFFWQSDNGANAGGTVCGTAGFGGSLAYAAVYGSVLTDNQIAYLARCRMGSDLG